MCSRTRLAIALLGLLVGGMQLVPSPSAAGPVTLCHGGSNIFSRVPVGPYDVGVIEVVDLPSEYDGASIHMAVIRPDVPRGMKVPVIVFASPYFVHNFHEIDPTSCEPRLTENYVSHGYAIGLVAVRGSADSGGCSDLFGPAEHSDVDQAVTWFGEQPWSNGRVGMVGVSYDGSTPWEVASMGNPYLKTIVPISGVSDLWHLMYRNGAPEFRAPLILNALYYIGFADEGRTPEHRVSGILCPEAFEGFAASLHSFATGQRDPFRYWAERNSRPGVEQRYRGSIFLVHGLQDWNVDPAHAFPWVTELDERGIYVKYLLGQWPHAYPDSNIPETARWDWAEILLHWWDYWLKGDEKADIGPGAQVQDSSGRWRNESSWPPEDATPKRFYLMPGGGLSAKASEAEETQIVALDPERLAGSPNASCPLPTECAGRPTFALANVGKDLRFAGLPRLDLTVTPTGPGGFISAWLYSLDEDGRSERVGWGMVDLRFAQGGETARTVVPMQELRVRVPIEPLDVVIPEGSSLVLVLSQGAYGGPDHLPTSPPYPIQVTVGGDNSVLTLDVFSRTRDAFFRPPKNPYESTS